MNAALLVLFLASAQVVGGEFTYTVRAGDTLGAIAARYGEGSSVIAAANGLKPGARLQPGQTLQMDNRHIVPDSAGVDIIVNVPQRMIFYFESGEVKQHYPIAAGKPSWPTPLGKFEIARAEESPTWHVPVSIQEEMEREGKPVLTEVPPSPQNPLGHYYLGLSLGDVGIHGTNAPLSIYSLQTHGCIRLHPDDIEKLFAAVDVGTTGKIVYEPVLVANIGRAVYFEVDSDAYKKGPAPLQKLTDAARAGGFYELIDWTLAQDVMRKHEGLARLVSR